MNPYVFTLYSGFSIILNLHTPLFTSDHTLDINYRKWNLENNNQILETTHTYVPIPTDTTRLGDPSYPCVVGWYASQKGYQSYNKTIGLFI